MSISVFDLFSIGIGPSSSHTVGPMRAAGSFLDILRETGMLTPQTNEVHRLQIDCYGSLGATGIGHGTDQAILMGLCGQDPETIDTTTIKDQCAEILRTSELPLGGWSDARYQIPFRPEDLSFHADICLPAHPNGMTFQAFNHSGTLIATDTYYSVGGGFILNQAAMSQAGGKTAQADADQAIPYDFATGASLLAVCAESGLSIAQVMQANESVQRDPEEISLTLWEIWRVMNSCIEAGMSAHGHLPGGLGVPRRAAGIADSLRSRAAEGDNPLDFMDWVNLYAMAVNEENAAGGRVVTAPTNGAAGVVPAVLRYYQQFVPGASKDKIIEFLLTAGAIGKLLKTNASISGAEVGCQGEVGSACAMAAAGLCAVLGGTPAQIENAAEIGVEHNLGLTCDPIGGLVQIPCIERNAIAAVKAINAARLALHGSGIHHVSFDQVMKTMRDTGHDMSEKYKETARGGLAVNVTEC